MIKQSFLLIKPPSPLLLENSLDIRKRVKIENFGFLLGFALVLAKYALLRYNGKRI